MTKPAQVLIVGAGIGGLTLALQLHEAGISARLIEAAPELRPLGVGINILPHASRELHRVGLTDKLASAAVQTAESVFYNRFGQFIYSEPLGAAAGYAWPQYSIHRGDLQLILAAEVEQRLGGDAIALGHTFRSFTQDEHGVTAEVETADGTTEIRAEMLIGCDGVHSAVRSQLHPGEDALVYSGYSMWRGVTRHERVLTGASMIRAGWLATGKLVVYPIRDNIDGSGRQLVNWVAEVPVPQRGDRDWNRDGHIADVIEPFADWRFPWLDVPELIRNADQILEYPMVDQEPLDRWSFGRVTLLGDAAHPMVPRGSNGAGQAIVDTRALTDALRAHTDVVSALVAYERERLPATAEVVRLNRTNPPDAILREVYERTGDKPFDRIEDVISKEELATMLQHYRQVTGSSHEALSMST
ncbi:flavin-dependent oxidoreductase [Streptomyces phaeolivaceus]|uniref:Flavin-dependent oxidoreductase n=1 Tax=Streptomyces phaeolivaceus TaxID=2653200 RepID=A0A5P8KED4_9ACTN|nr:flavin-dependent oxidoreductase [Streptomyces phaeolivaceus]QFR01694.1 flavin-dependent oxidoreductase [Streptomyces phaeolivaceus]